jgi:DNA-binding beta-propeller fold protein YncE
LVPVLVTLTVALVGAQAGSYRITRTYPLGGEGSWDYVVPDPPNHRLFIARQNRVMVIDEDSGKLLGEVTGINGAHRIAIAASSGDGFATSGTDRSVVMFDLKTFKTLDRIPAAEDATVTRRWSTAPCRRPAAMAVDVPHHRLFSGCRSGVLAVSNYHAGTIVPTVPIGTGVDGAAYDPASADAFASNADGTLTVIHQDGPDQYYVAQTLTTPPFSRNLGLDPGNHRVFVPGAKFGPAPAGGRGRGPLLADSFSVLVIDK